MAKSVQIFGLRNSHATRAAERFFKERNVAIHFVDLKQKAMAPAEIGRFVQRFGLENILDSSSKAYENAGLKYLKVGDSDMLARIEKEPGLLRLPLIRSQNLLSVGEDMAAWKSMI
jgi:arsenate reductase-like glutaredoxin family protein